MPDFQNKNLIYPVAIIGAGPAGISCALQLKRQGIEPVIFEKKAIGGLLRNANLIENYPGYASGIKGIELAENFIVHLQKLNLNPIFEEVIRINFEEDGFSIRTKNFCYKSKTLVVASGTQPKETFLNIDENIKHHVFYEICELYKHNLTEKKVAVIGSGDAAFDYAINLASNSNAAKIFILNRSSKTKCLNLLKERALNNPKIKYIENEEPAGFFTASGKSVVACKSSRKIESDYLLLAIGRKPVFNFFDEEITNNLEKFKTAKKLFFIGDVKNEIFRQTAIAVGDGIKAAMEIHTDFAKKNADIFTLS